MKKQQGLTLIELMISLVLGLFLIAATLNIYIGTVRSSSDTLKATRLNHDLEMAMSLMMNDIRRAGRWSGAMMEADSRSNPFTQATTDIRIRNFATPTAVVMTGNCILYSYDANAILDTDTNGDGVLDADKIPEADEFYGFRLNNGTIEMRMSGTTTADCTDGTWQSIVDENMITITAMQFSVEALPAGATAPLTGTSRCIDYSATPFVDTGSTFNCAAVAANATSAVESAAGVPAGNNAAQKRVVNIILTGQVKSDADVTKTLSGTVKIANNRLFTP